MHDNTCVCCGAVIPEGRQVCSSCEQKYTGGCTDCAHSADDFGRCLIAKTFDFRANHEHGCNWKVPIKRRAIQTNGDLIRAMTDDELAAFLYNITSCCYFQKCKDCQFYHVYNCDYPNLRDWVKSEVSGNA